MKLATAELQEECFTDFTVSGRTMLFKDNCGRTFQNMDCAASHLHHTPYKVITDMRLIFSKKAQIEQLQ